MHRFHQLHRPSLLLSLLALGACHSGDYDGPTVPDLVANAEYERAVRIGAQLFEEAPDDESAEANYRAASVALLIERARRATFDDRDDEAMEHLKQATEIDPDNPAVKTWHLKTSRKLSNLWLDRALSFTGRGDLVNAMEAYETALKFDPSSSAAKQGVGRMLLLTNYRAGRGEDYYREGVRALRSYWLHQARAKFNYASEKFIPNDSKSLERSVAVQNLLADERVAEAENFEVSGLYFAAGNEYRLALLLDPTNELAADGRKRMAKEAGAISKLEHADWLQLRGRFDLAREALAEGMELTEAQVGAFEVGAIDIEEQEFQIMYDEARRLEDDFQYPEAVVAYEQLLEVSGFYQDAITRRSVLQEAVVQADGLYAQSQGTEDLDERMGFLYEIELVWPEYKDVAAQLKLLEKSDLEKSDSE
ncbi:MAG: tetratricopeptide (TPR) repeat protein [Planctomycetota bacterium]|jgi:tetratricopeptide (TPR) repeat protein